MEAGDGSALPQRGRTYTITDETPRDDARILLAASKDEEGSRERVRELLVREPAWVERLGSLADDAERELVAAGRPQTLMQECVRAEIRQSRERLTQPTDGPLERLLVERAVLSWAAVTHAETRRAIYWQNESIGHDQANFWDRRVSRLHSDFLRACKTLATVRKLHRPTVQVNIGAQQLCVAQSG